jgi:hypothetical protein
MGSAGSRAAILSRHAVRRDVPEHPFSRLGRPSLAVRRDVQADISLGGMCTWRSRHPCGDSLGGLRLGRVLHDAVTAAVCPGAAGAGAVATEHLRGDPAVELHQGAFGTALADLAKDARDEHGERERAGQCRAVAARDVGDTRRRWRGSLARFLSRQVRQSPGERSQAPRRGVAQSFGTASGGDVGWFFRLVPHPQRSQLERWPACPSTHGV